MRSTDILNEARIHGALNDNELFIGLSGNGSDLVILPKAVAGRDNGRMRFKLNPAGQAIIAKIKQANPPKDWHKIDEVGAKRDLQANIKEITAAFEPAFDVTQMDPSLVRFYLDSFKSQMSKDIEGLWSMFSATITFGRDLELSVYVGFYALEFLHLDLQKQTFDIIHQDKNHNSRMGTYKGRDTTYMLIDADFSVNDNRKLHKALKSLVGKFPALADFDFVDGRSGQVKRTPVSQLLAGTDNTDNTVKQLITATTGSISAYHGTSKAVLKQIIQDGVMIPGKGPEYSDKILGHSDKLIYFTLDIEQARKFAVRAAGGREAVIIKAEINDMTRLRFDEDALAEAIRKLPDRIYPNFEKLFYKVFQLDTADEYKSRSHLDQTLRGYLIKDYSKFTEPQKKLIGYLGALALKANNLTSGYSFGYAGRLPLDKLVLAETFKSQRYIDRPESDYSAQYDDVKATQEFPNTPLSSFKKKKK